MTRVKEAWRETFLRNVKCGRTITETCRLCNIGVSRVNQEFRKDPQFKRQVEEAAGRSLDNLTAIL